MQIRFYNLFIVFALTFLSKKICGQTITPNRYKTLTVHADSLLTRQRVPFMLQNDSYVKNLGFFCMQEWKFEKATKLPLRFRLGSLDQCNLLEGKK
jgi:hypothetical protein